MLAGPGMHPTPYTMNTVSFPGVNRPGCGLKHPPPFSVEVKEKRYTPAPPVGVHGLYYGVLYFTYFVISMQHAEVLLVISRGRISAFGKALQTENVINFVYEGFAISLNNVWR